MSACKRCPHHVRHGQVAANGQIAFANVCGLKVRRNFERDELLAQAAGASQANDRSGAKKGADKKNGASQKAALPMPMPRKFDPTTECTKHPFSGDFDYMQCDVYIDTFKSNNRKNDVVPTKDFQFSEAFAGGSITDMEYL